MNASASVAAINFALSLSFKELSSGPTLEAGGHGVGVLDLAMFVLKHICPYSVQNAFRAPGQGGAVAGRVHAIASCFNAKEFDGGVFREGVEHAHYVTSSANASNDCIWKLALLLVHLRSSLIAENRLESTDDPGERMRTDG